jgi:LysR family glycine cleavage system transcriptional activator
MRRRIPPLDTLLCFDAAARHESYTRAAQELALTQSAVSRRIAALEDFLGVALFRRTRHGVALTPAGAAYARQMARRLAAMERDTLDAMAREGEGPGGGTVSLAAVPTFATRWLLPRLHAFQARHPDITIHIETRTRPFLFADTDFDAALYAGTPAQMASWAGTQAEHLLDEQIAPVCSPRLLPRGRPVGPAALAQLPLLQQSTRPDMWAQWFDAHGVDAPLARRGARYELFSLTAAAAAHGLGVALAPLLLVQEELRRGELTIACGRPGPGDRAYYLVRPDGPDATPALAAFQAWLLAEARPDTKATP